MIKKHQLSNKRCSLVPEVSFLLRSGTGHSVYCSSFHRVEYLFCKMGLFSVPASRRHCCWWQHYKKESGFSHGFPLAWRNCSLPAWQHQVPLRQTSYSTARSRKGECISFSLNQCDLTVRSQRTHLWEVIQHRSSYWPGIEPHCSFSLSQLCFVVAAGLKKCNEAAWGVWEYVAMWHL